MNPHPRSLVGPLAAVLVFGLASACSLHSVQPRPGISGAAVEISSCAFPNAAIVVKRDGDAILQYWQFEDSGWWSQPTLPLDPAFAEYRQAIEAAGADVRLPAQVVPENDRDKPGWQRELSNIKLAYNGTAGTIRPIRCLEALLFGTQYARNPQLDRPTEFIASILGKTVDGRPTLRVYFGSANTKFPPKTVYGLDEAAGDVADGWTYLAMLHNHTIQTAGEGYRLGVPAPSVSDVQLLRALAEHSGLLSGWVTNGFYTIVIPADQLGRYIAPP